jgi:hypothetical protein
MQQVCPDPLLGHLCRSCLGHLAIQSPRRALPWLISWHQTLQVMGCDTVTGLGMQRRHHLAPLRCLSPCSSDSSSCHCIPTGSSSSDSRSSSSRWYSVHDVGDVDQARRLMQHTRCLIWHAWLQRALTRHWPWYMSS